MQSIYQTRMYLQKVGLAAMDISLGVLLLILCSWIRIPFYPVPFTLQTGAIFFLALTRPWFGATVIPVIYLLLATLGFPVFGFKCNPLWFSGPCAGYLIAFPLAALVVAYLKKRSRLLAVLVGQILIYTLGALWLGYLFDMKIALTQGVLFFLPSDSLKMMAALWLSKRYRRSEQ